MKDSYYQRNKETIKKKRKQYYEKNKKRLLKGMKEWKEAHPDYMKKARENWLKQNPTYDAYHNAKRRAKELKIPFDLSYKDIVVPTHCPVFGFKFDFSSRELSPSLDRIDNSKGYTKGNVRVISMKANRIKSNGTAEEHMKIAQYINGELNA